MGFHFAQVVTELSRRISMGLKVEGFQKGLMKLRSSPRRDTGSGVNEDFHEADESRIVDFDSWDFSMAGNDG